MKTKILIGVILISVAWIGYRGYRMSTTRSHSLVDTTDFTYGGLDVQVVYGKPSKKGRLIFGEAKQRMWLPKGKFWTVGFRMLTGLPSTSGALVPHGEYWRLGANDATEISFSKNINFGGRPVEAGRYRMYAIPNASTWQVCLNSELGKFGYKEPNYALDVLRINLPVESTPSEIEQFTIDFSTDSTGLKMNFAWDKTLVRIPISIQ